MKFLGISINISELIGKMIFLSFHSCSCDIVSPSFAYQDGGFHITVFSTVNANILRTKSSIEKRSTTFFPILSDLTSVINMLLGLISL